VAEFAIKRLAKGGSERFGWRFNRRLERARMGARLAIPVGQAGGEGGQGIDLANVAEELGGEWRAVQAMVVRGVFGLQSGDIHVAGAFASCRP